MIRTCTSLIPTGDFIREVPLYHKLIVYCILSWKQHCINIGMRVFMTLGCNAATKSTMHFSDISNLVSNPIEEGTIKAQPCNLSTHRSVRYTAQLCTRTMQVPACMLVQHLLSPLVSVPWYSIQYILCDSLSTLYMHASVFHCVCVYNCVKDENSYR